MTSGGFGGFGGFGQSSTTNQTSAGFGSAFGQPSGTTSGFGSTTNNAGFGGTANTGGSLFGGTSSGFGGSGGTFGTTTPNTGFGAKPTFGVPVTTGGSLFGNNTTTSNAGGGFGFNSNNTSTASPFGGGSTGVGLFGQTKQPAFGGTSGTTTTPFGGTSAFGGGSTAGAFGGAGTALGVPLGENPGTAAVPFQAFMEKEPNSANSQQQNAFQNIVYQQPYQKFSQEELRLADYMQGRRYGNASGQAGAFGQSTNFGGGFGNNTTTSGFGNNNPPSTGMFGNASGSGFGQNNQTTSTSFGNGGATSLFGAKPAATTGSLFGAPPQPAGGTTSNLFGSSSSGFGNTSGNAFGSNAAPSLFGGSSQAKPFSFSNQTTSAAAPFGGNAAGTSAFGSTGSTLFGSNTPAQNTTTPFGGNAQTTAPNPFGGFGNNTQAQTTTPSLFGNNNQPKPALGLFGSTNNTPATTGLFGTTNSGTSAFGNTANNQQQGGGLFGAAKPTPSLGGGLFGNNNTTANPSTNSLFGGLGSNQNNQGQQGQNNTPSLFGSLNQQQPKPSLFGGSQPQSNTGGLFGNSTNTQTGGSLFGNNSLNQQQQPQQNSLFGSLNNPANQPSQPGSLTASINDPTAFGTSMFSTLGTTQVVNPGPLATPLSSLSKHRKGAILPMYRMNPASASRNVTPMKQGFGFTYSTYGTPGSASSTSSTPIAFGNSMMGAGSSRGLTKSVSTNSLRASYNSSFNREDSILAPGAFSASPSSRFTSTGSMKRLVINRGLKVDLFSPPKETSPAIGQGGIIKKRVSFESSTSAGSKAGLNGTSSPLKQVLSGITPSSEELGYMRPPRSNNGSVNGSKPNGTTSSPPEMEQVVGTELAIVPEEGPPAPIPARALAKSPLQDDQEPGQYWMRPSKEDILNMNRTQRQKVSGFTVGREGVGQVQFDTPVDLNTINLDEIFGKLVILDIRKATVYPDQSKKPPVGKGLNVPSTIQLENSWPRGRDKRNPSHERAGPRFQKHIERLSKVPDTSFRDYNKDTGVWTFTVQHFTTYGLEYDDDDEMGDATSEFGHSTLSALPDTPTPAMQTPRVLEEVSFASSEVSVLTESDPEDTFDFKKKKSLPGAFNDDVLAEYDEEMQDDDEDMQSFLDDGSAGSRSENGVDETMEYDEYSQSRELIRIEDQEMAGSYLKPDDTAEQTDDDSQEMESKNKLAEAPGSIVRARMRAMRTSGSPLKRKLRVDDDDWTEMLRQTVSPQKQDREKLKQLKEAVSSNDFRGEPGKEVPPKSNMGGRVVSDGRGFSTSIDLMHSLFGDAKNSAKVPKVPKVPSGKGFEWPYAKRSKASDFDESKMNEVEKSFHKSLKLNWDASGTIVFAAPASLSAETTKGSADKDGLVVVQKRNFDSEAGEVHFARFSNESSGAALKKHRKITNVAIKDGIPYATLHDFKFGTFFEDFTSTDQATAHEKLVWELASVLFDAIDVPDSLKSVPNISSLLRKENLSVFWKKLVAQASNQHVAMAKSNEEKAIACLTANKIPEACGHLLNGQDFRLATLVSLIGGSKQMKRDIREQLTEWQKSRVLSEFSQPTRTIYELLAGNVCVCDGSKGAPIEDRMETFIISKRFGFDWRQAFGLRLWYAILSNEDFVHAVEMFQEDLAQEKETAKPQAWYIEQGIPPLWDDKDAEKREDLLWGLLKLYADHDTDLESVLRPENSQLSPMNVRLSWQLSRALLASGCGSYGTESDEKSDQLTLSFVSQLTNEGNWLDATFALLHLSSAPARAKAIQDHLAHHAGRIGPEDGQAFTTLTQDFRIPPKWIWEVKALYMRSVKKDSKGEVDSLIRAGAFDEAHRTFAREVAPRSVIERDWDTVRSLLAGFKGREHSIAEWHLGGELYSDYLMLVEAQKKGVTKFDAMLLERLLAVLPAVVGEGRHASFIETVAVQEITSVVANIVSEMAKRSNNKDLSRLLRLPLTEDMCLKHTVDLSVGFYSTLMASGR